jgi:heterodisulfide reductase subunit C
VNELNVSSDTPSSKRVKYRKVRKDDIDNVEFEEDVVRKSVVGDDYDNNEDCNINRKGKRVSEGLVIKMECIDFGPCAGSPPGNSKKTYSFKVLIKPAKNNNIISKLKILAKKSGQIHTKTSCFSISGYWYH